MGSANFAESALLGEVYAQALEAKGYRVTRRFSLGTRETYYELVKSGQVDVIPEYIGALAVSLDPSSTAVTATEVNTVLARTLPPQLAMLRSAPAEDKDTVTVTRRIADLYGLRTIADLEPVAGDLVMGGSAEFQTRYQGLVGLRGTYGLNFRGYQPFATDDRATVVDSSSTTTSRRRTSSRPNPRSRNTGSSSWPTPSTCSARRTSPH